MWFKQAGLGKAFNFVAGKSLKTNDVRISVIFYFINCNPRWLFGACTLATTDQA